MSFKPRKKRENSHWEICDWIRNNFDRSECSLFISRTGERSEDSLCHCNNTMKQHSNEAIIKSRNLTISTWSPTLDTRKIPTDAFGEIEFPGYGNRVAKYVCVREQTNMEKILILFMNVWKIPRPNLLISVTGGAKSFTMAPKLKDIFRRGLTKAACSTGAWIITGGMNAGVMMHVGEALKNHNILSNSSKKVPCIGIAPWGCVGLRDRLISPTGKWPAAYRCKEGTKLHKNESLLDDNHTHFIFVDNGTSHKYRVEIEFRAKFEEYISNMRTSNEEEMTIPIILLVMEGGIGTLETVASSIKRNTPALIIEGSGRAADVLAKIYNYIEVNKAKDLDSFVTNAIKNEFGSNNLNEMVFFAKSCFQNMDLVNVISLDGKEEIDNALLKALFKANKEHQIAQLKLALIWNKVEMAKSELFYRKTNIDPVKLMEVLHSAVLSGNTSFVRLICENGVDVKRFLTVDRLLKLYNQIPAKSQLAVLLKKYKKSKRDTSLRDVGLVLQYLMGDFFQPVYLTDSRYLENKSKFSEKFDVEQKYTPEINSVEIEESHQELFIWCVLMNKLELAYYFWVEGKNPVMIALIASNLLRKLSKLTNDHDLKDLFELHSIKYNDLAIGVINECWKYDEQRAHLIMLRQFPNLGPSNSLTIAAQTTNKDFVSHFCCQSLISKIWMGRISEETSIWKLILCNILPLMIPFYVKFDMIENSPRRPQEGRDCGPPSKLGQVKDSMERFGLFYSAPVVIFMSNCFTYMIFLILYSYVLLVEYSGNFSYTDYALTVFVISLLAEEVRQFVAGKNVEVRTKLKDYFHDFWNVLDFTSSVIFLIGQAIRFSCDSEDKTCFDMAKTTHSLSLMLFYFRLLHIFSASKHLGPKVVMIGKMMVDLLVFVAILLVFMISFGIVQHAILYPNSELTPSLPFHVFSKAYWQIFGELFLGDIGASEAAGTCSFNESIYKAGIKIRCPTEFGKYIIPIFLGFYLIFTSALMLNLLIAMFSSTFTKIQESTDKHWCFQRYQLIYEYYNRPSLAPPFILISHFFLLLTAALGLFKMACIQPKSDSSDDYVHEFEMKQLILWENQRADDFIRWKETESINRPENKILELEETIKAIKKLVDFSSTARKIDLIEHKIMSFARNKAA